MSKINISTTNYFRFLKIFMLINFFYSIRLKNKSLYLLDYYEPRKILLRRANPRRFTVQH